MLWPLYLLLVFALFSPLEISGAVRLTLRGGYGEATVRFMTLRMQFPFRISIFEHPYFTVERILPDGRGKRVFYPGMPKKPHSDLMEIAVLAADNAQLRVLWIVGTGDAMDTALLCGLLKELTTVALTLGFPSAESRAEAMPRWDAVSVRLEAAGITTLQLAEIIRRVLWIRREKKNGASVGNHHAHHH